jgi:hypothetical protein
MVLRIFQRCLQLLQQFKTIGEKFQRKGYLDPGSCKCRQIHRIAKGPLNHASREQRGYCCVCEGEDCPLDKKLVTALNSRTPVNDNAECLQENHHVAKNTSSSVQQG